MKNMMFNSTRWMFIFLAVFGVLFMSSCGEDPVTDDTTTVLVEDGFYIQGDATLYTDFDIDATLSATRNEVPQADRAELLEIFVAVRGTGGFNIIEVAGATRTTWGPGSDFADVVGGDNDQPQVTFQRGSIAETTTQFTVPSDGLYHVVIDTEVGIGTIVPVQYWGIIGGATPGGWSDDTQMPHTGFDMSTMTFEATDIAMTLGDFKFRYSGGWKVEIDTTYDLGSGSTGIKVNANFGGAVDALVPGGDNITNAESGFYTATIVWTAGSGFAATLTRTGDLPTADWSSVELGLVGAGLVIDNIGHNWDVTAKLHTPQVSGVVYTWTYNDVGVLMGQGGFKIREGQDWSGTIIGFNEVTLEGDGAADFETNGDGNFVPLIEGAVYDMTLVIDAATEVYTLTMDRI